MELKIPELAITIFTQVELAMTGQFLIGAVLALLFGYVIGWERKQKDKPAGIVTHAFVILGSLAFTIVGAMNGMDATRIAAAVAQGIGFLGAGMIITGEDKVENLTTAAGVWLSAAIGVALGFKLYLISCCIVAMMFCARFLPGAKRE